MHKKLLIPFVGLFSLFLTITVRGQKPESKISLSLLQKMQDAQRNAANINVLIKGNIDEIKAKMLEIGGTFGYAIGNSIASVLLPINKVNEIASLSSVSRIEDN